MNGKKWYKSKTVGLGGTLAVLGLAILQLPQLQAVIEQVPVEHQGAATLVVGIAVVVLRQVTTEPLDTNKKAVESQQDAH